VAKIKKVIKPLKRMFKQKDYLCGKETYPHPGPPPGGREFLAFPPWGKRERG